MAALPNLPSPIRPVVISSDVSMSSNPPVQSLPVEKHMVHWFRKGLRMHDNPSLREGLKGCTTFRCVFILDPWFAGSSNVGINKWRFLLQCLEDLDLNLRKLNSRLFVIRGQPADILPKLFKEWKTTCLTFEEDPEPFGKVRDQNIMTLCKELSIEVISRVSHTLYDLDKIIEKNGGKTPLTYHQFQYIVAKLESPPPAEAMVTPLLVRDAFTPLRDDHEDKYGVPTLEELGFDIEGLQPPTWKGGETEALRRLERHLERKAWVASFGRPKMTPQSLLASPTGLSPFLRFGCLSTRLFYHDLNKLYKRIKKAPPPLSLHGQLLWREFFYCAATRNPNFDRMLGNPICVQIPWDTNVEALAKWANAQTGFPWIDAIMTQLREEGWIHHLARHAVACFLTRGDLWVSWEEGMKIFDELLLDADWSVNAGMWMWLSCSSFFQQFFQCYCPIKFGRKADPNGDFIRRYLPILKNVPTRYIHEPWIAPHSVQKASKCVIGLNYPLPMVNHPVVSKMNIERIKQVYRLLANYRGSQIHKCIKPKSPEAMIIDTYNSSAATLPPPSPMTPQTLSSPTPLLAVDVNSTDVIQYPPCCHGDPNVVSHTGQREGKGSMNQTQGNPKDALMTEPIRDKTLQSTKSEGKPLYAGSETLSMRGKPINIDDKPISVSGNLHSGKAMYSLQSKQVMAGKPTQTMNVPCHSDKPSSLGKVLQDSPMGQDTPNPVRGKTISMKHPAAMYEQISGEYSKSTETLNSKIGPYAEPNYQDQLRESECTALNDYSDENPNPRILSYSMAETEEAMLNEETNVIEIADSIISESEERQKLEQ